jgi:endonuclease/exonuclease/phosphatase family metal-dependent hydrolase
MNQRLIARTLRWALPAVAALVSIGAFPAQAEENCSEVRLMTFNIRYGTAADGDNHWYKRRRLVFDVIARHRPDVVGLQEALRFQIDEILAALPDFAAVGTGRDDGKAAGEHVALLYRKDRFVLDQNGDFWFSETPEIPGSKHWGNQITRMCTWARFTAPGAGRGFFVFNVHLDHQSQPSRERSVALLIERIRSRGTRETVFLTGDFNAGESNPAVLHVKGEKPVPADEVTSRLTFQDTFRVVHPNASLVGTFNGFSGDRSGEKIDYIFALPGIEVKEATIVDENRDGSFPSDHFPVTAVVCLP